MATRKPKNSELAQAADNLAEAAQLVGKAVSQKIDEVRNAASAELSKAKDSAVKKGHMAQGKLDSLIKKVEVRLKKVTVETEKSLGKAVREAEKRINTAKKAAKVKITEMQKAAAQAAKPAKPVKKAAAKKAAATKAPVKKAAVKRAVVKKAAAKKAAAKKAAAA
jgi:DNA-binding protein HU-beta